jgi:hypothetical protein
LKPPKGTLTKVLCGKKQAFFNSTPHYRVTMEYSQATPESPPESQPVIGLIGMGEMGRMYARHLSAAGWRRYGQWQGSRSARCLKRSFSESTSVIFLRDMKRYSANLKVRVLLLHTRSCRGTKIPSLTLWRYRRSRHHCTQRWTSGLEII